ncbi:hypothetical protein LOD99_444 [Oopsacas minuta]|uniref:Yip1 domain-containing protein n=1 Tax=Oopsacas minuta TaxID=111878 RepID=A0AAV7KAH5_9METZ|nr:hypothetical protein LOD99_444 [Oopsacas minuta]
MAVSIDELKKEHPNYFRVQDRFNKRLNSKDACESFLATNSTHVLIHYFAQYMYARPNADFGIEGGFSKQTLNWLNLILFFFVIAFILVFMLLVPIACLGTGVYGQLSSSRDDLSNIQLMVVGSLAIIEFIARVVWYFIGRLDTKDSVFTYVETFDFLPVPIIALFIWGIVEAVSVQFDIYSVVNAPLLLNVLGVLGWGIYLLFRLQKFAISILDGIFI